MVQILEATNRGERGPFSATGDVGGTGLFSGFTVIGSQAGQGGDLVAVAPQP